MSKFALLLRLANDRLEAAAERMRKAQQAQQHAQQMLLQLDSFIADYQQRMLAQGQAGMSVLQWQDYRLFMQKLAMPVSSSSRKSSALHSASWWKTGLATGATQAQIL